MSTGAIAFIGGTSLYELPGIRVLEERVLGTPFGEPSSPITIASAEDTQLLFLARHGRQHQFLPSEVNYRANIWALKSLGASWCFAIGAIGSLSDAIAPGDFVIPDQLIDRTRRRNTTFFGSGLSAYISFGEPYCPTARTLLCDVTSSYGNAHSLKVHTAGTYLCMEGPALSTRAESNLYRSWGADVIGMTNLPEAKLAREAEIAYATLGMVSDYDCWKESVAEVSAAGSLEVLKTLSQHSSEIVQKLIPIVAEHEPSEMAANALSSALIGNPKDAPKEVLQGLEPLLRRFI